MKLTNWEKNILINLINNELNYVEENCNKAELNRYKKLLDKIESEV